jgi:hypothetical protein
MRRVWVVTWILILSVIISSPLFSNTAVAITGNFQPELASYVGVVVLFSDAARQQPFGYCSGFLISPTVMVIAGHSLQGTEAVSVCFDKGPISYTIQDKQIIYYGTSTIYTGKPLQYPLYVPSLSDNEEFGTSDIGLIILDKPVKSVKEFPKLPQAGYGETLATKTDLTVIGYGYQYQTNPRNNGPEYSWSGLLSRNSAQVQLVSANFEGSSRYLKLTANDAQGKGAIVFGDSGGPVIYNNGYQDIVLALNAFISSDNCGGVSYHTRLDTPQVLAWIKGYLK